MYNTDETGVMLSTLGSVKVLVSKHDKRDYRGARVNRTTVTSVIDKVIFEFVSDFAMGRTPYEGFG